MHAFLDALPGSSGAAAAWGAPAARVNEALLVPTQVNYVCKAANLYEDAGYEVRGYEVGVRRWRLGGGGARARAGERRGRWQVWDGAACGVAAALAARPPQKDGRQVLSGPRPALTPALTPSHHRRPAPWPRPRQLSGSSYVIGKSLSTSWLWDRVRVSGGAYGGYCDFDTHSGMFTYSSYRDPNLLKTVDVYDGARRAACLRLGRAGGWRRAGAGRRCTRALAGWLSQHAPMP